ncbi:DUF2785 domain-containing protein [Actinopolymorpha pittospori]|uniref:DUF2785 domain-containing protein n=1 Tax=Actinopolymorpha pittospori TaxID=648752 RepID=A0A927N3H9_9ACTN|nr:hypothetical protein [Actinopolymorpha pittospori]
MGVRAAYWEQVRASGFRLPHDRPLDDLTAELVHMLGDVDPKVRDGIAYPVLAAWISEGVYDDLLAGFGDGVSEGLFNGLGEDGTDSVLRRSFSALLLAESVLRDQVARAVHSDAIFRWGDRAASWFVRERDLRGYVEGRGWAHAVAHGADLIAALARSEHFGKLELTVLLDVIADRLLTPTTHRLLHGEDDRLAFAVMTVLHRNRLGIDVLEPWVERLAASLVPPVVDEGTTAPAWPTPVAGNTAGFLRGLHLQLALGVRGQQTPQDVTLFGKPPQVRADLLLVLLRVLRAGQPAIFSTPSR